MKNKDYFIGDKDELVELMSTAQRGKYVTSRNLLANTNASKNEFFILSPKTLFLFAFGL